MMVSSQRWVLKKMKEDAESIAASNICHEMNAMMISKNDGNSADSIYVLFYDSE
jgi:hypothetical protein